MTYPYSLSFVVPCYNEVDNIRLFKRRAFECFDAEGISLEIVFVNDGSQDGTFELLREVVSETDPSHPMQAVQFSRNFGKEAALYAGMEAARGECICLIDADLQQTPEDALRMYKLLMDKPEYDIVAACQIERKESVVLKLFKHSFYKTFNGICTDIEIPANVSDFRVFRHTVADALLSLPEGQRFSKGLFAWVGFKTLEVPYEPDARANGESKWSVKSLFHYAANGILGFTTWPLKVAVWIGLVASLGGFAYLLWIIFEYALRGTDVPGFPTLACLILLFGGLQLTVLGVIGEYLSRSYIEGSTARSTSRRSTSPTRRAERARGRASAAGEQRGLLVCRHCGVAVARPRGASGIRSPRALAKRVHGGVPFSKSARRGQKMAVCDELHIANLSLKSPTWENDGERMPRCPKASIRTHISDAFCPRLCP